MKDLEQFKLDNLSFASCLIMQILLFFEPLKSVKKTKKNCKEFKIKRPNLRLCAFTFNFLVICR